MQIHSGRLWSALAGAAVALAVLVVAWLAVVFGGGFNVAASEGHAPAVRWTFDTAMRNSVQARAAGIAEPAVFTEAQIAAGAGEFKAMCEQCHGGPGVERENWAEGMQPHPPDLARAAEHWRAREVFWIAKHGIKMTAMPAFGESHDDRTLWNIAGFVKALPAMTPERYAAFEGGHGGEDHHHTPAGG